LTTPDILNKLRTELDAGIETEPQVVYLLAGIRKLMERDGVKGKYPMLNFHCDWALHSKLEGPGAKRILRQLDAAHPLKKDQKELPRSLQSNINRILTMRSFQQELDGFLGDYGLPPLTRDESDGWPHFLYLYVKVIEDIPLVVVQAKSRRCRSLQRLPTRDKISAAKHISKVVVSFQETAPEKDIEGEAIFRVTWTIHDKNGQSGSYQIYNSYSR
jgi:hypothetical protein